MSEESNKSNQQTYTDTANVIFSAAYSAGHSPCVGPDGQMMFQFGREAVPVSRSAKRVKVKVRKMNATSGPNSSGSSPSVGHRLSLANRLAARLDVNGSLEYTLTWKRSAIECHETSRGTMSSTTFRLRASARRTSDSGCSGWPTPQAHDVTAGKTATQIAAMRAKGHGVSNLTEVGNLTGWPSPTAQDHNRGGLPPRPHDTGIPLTQMVALTGWATPTAVNHRSPKSNQHGKNSRPLQEQAGTTTESSSVETSTSKADQSTGGLVLNGAMSRWLMGFPESWDRLSPGWNKWEFVQRELTAWDG